MTRDSPTLRRRWLAAAGAGFGAAALVARGGTAAQEVWPPITAFPPDTWSPGRRVWADLFTEDVGASERFYGAVFGWNFARASAMGGRYRLALADDEAVGAIVPREAGPGTAPGSRWMPLMWVEDPARAARQAGRAGGRAIVAPISLPASRPVAPARSPRPQLRPLPPPRSTPRPPPRPMRRSR